MTTCCQGIVAIIIGSMGFSILLLIHNLLLQSTVAELNRQRKEYLSVPDEEFAKHIKHPDFKLPVAEAEHSGPPDGMVLLYNGLSWKWRDTNNPASDDSIFRYKTRSEAVQAAWDFHDMLWERINHPFTNAP